MEVHQHSHTARKKWTHYFWEFLMLFLAVFCGFLAENFREHQVEHQRGKVYGRNLYEELKKDTARLTSIIKGQARIKSGLDTLCILMRNKRKDSITAGMLYYYGSVVTHVNYFASRNTTVEQLKGSGNLRIMGPELSYQISEYDRLIRDLEKEYGLSKTEFAKLEDVHFRVFDIYIMETMFGDGKDDHRDSLFRLRDLPVNQSSDLLQEYIGWVKFEANIYKYQSESFLDRLKQAAEKLLKTLEEKYHLK